MLEVFGQGSNGRTVSASTPVIRSLTAVNLRKPAPSEPTLSWPVHRDLARILRNWGSWIERLGRDALFLLVVLEAIRLEERETDTFRYRELEQVLDVSPATLRRWIAILKQTGALTTEPVPGSNRTAAHFQIHLDAARSLRKGALTSKRTREPRPRTPSGRPPAPGRSRRRRA
jgi:hypothetical protein